MHAAATRHRTALAPQLPAPLATGSILLGWAALGTTTCALCFAIHSRSVPPPPTAGPTTPHELTAPLIDDGMPSVGAINGVAFSQGQVHACPMHACASCDFITTAAPVAPVGGRNDIHPPPAHPPPAHSPPTEPSLTHLLLRRDTLLLVGFVSTANLAQNFYIATITNQLTHSHDAVTAARVSSYFNLAFPPLALLTTPLTMLLFARLPEHAYLATATTLVAAFCLVQLSKLRGSNEARMQLEAV